MKPHPRILGVAVMAVVSGATLAGTAVANYVQTQPVVDLTTTASPTPILFTPSPSVTPAPLVTPFPTTPATPTEADNSPAPTASTQPAKKNVSTPSTTVRVAFLDRLCSYSPYNCIEATYTGGTATLEASVDSVYEERRYSISWGGSGKFVKSPARGMTVWHATEPGTHILTATFSGPAGSFEKSVTVEVAQAKVVEGLSAITTNNILNSSKDPKSGKDVARVGIQLRNANGVNLYESDPLAVTLPISADVKVKNRNTGEVVYTKSFSDSEIMTQLPGRAYLIPIEDLRFSEGDYLSNRSSLVVETVITTPEQGQFNHSI